MKLTKDEIREHEAIQEFAHFGTILIDDANMEHFPGAEVIDTFARVGVTEVKATAKAEYQEKIMLEG